MYHSITTCPAKVPVTVELCPAAIKAIANKEGAKFSFIEKRLAIAPVMVHIIHRWSPITHSYRITTVSDGKIT